MNESEMQAELERLRAENAQLKSKDKGGLTLKVSEKGALSLYGMGRFPVTLYKEQWLRILASAAEIAGRAGGSIIREFLLKHMTTNVPQRTEP
jgi:hypothetical protein